jgi:ligand-binding sensor domain-containing protein/two-component sensor histidine kinase
MVLYGAAPFVGRAGRRIFLFFHVCEKSPILFGRCLVLIAACAALCFGVLKAQRLPIRNYTVKDGLTRNAVRCVLQDSLGWMWFGTAEGLDRYDGGTFMHFTSAHGLSDNFINALVADRAGTLWIATNFGGLTRLHSGVFTALLVDSAHPSAFSNHINCLLPDPRAGYWVGTDDGLFFFAHNRFTLIEPGIAATVLARDSAGVLWIGTPGGLLRFDEREQKAVLAQNRWDVTALACDRLGALWIGTTRGLQFIPPTASRRWQLERLARYLQKQWIRCIHFDEDNTAWVGTSEFGVVRFAPNGMITFISEANGLAGNVVNDIVRDSEGNIWIATTMGLSKIISEQIVNYTHAHGLPDYGVSAVTRDATGAMWFGTRLGLVRLLDGVLTTLTTADGLPSSYVLTLLTDAGGAVWCGTDAGPARLRARRGGLPRIEQFGVREGWKPSDGKPNRVRAIYQDEERNLWFGNDDGIGLLHRGRFSTHTLRGAYGERLVAGLVRDSYGKLWAALHTGGIVRLAVAFQPDGTALLTERRHFGMPDGLTDDHMRCALRARDGSLWFGTRFGGAVRIAMRNDTVFALRTFTTNQGLASNWVNGIVEDQRGNIWLATSRGMNRLTLPSSESGVPTVQTLTIFDGLAGEGVNAVYEDVNGTLWFATYNGVTRYDPAGDMPPQVPPRIYITDVSVSGQTDSAALRLGHGSYDHQQHSIAFDFIGVSFRDEARVRYRYVLEGLDTSWSPLTERRYMQYTHLPPGEYTFRVKAQNGAGVWSNEAASFRFVIASPIWSRWWFAAGIVALAAAAVWLAHRSRVQRLLAVERLRLRIAADLHDDLGSTLSSIAIAGALAQKEMTAPSPRVAEALARITTSARSMLEGLDDIVWSINPSNDRLDDLVLRMRSFAAELCEPKEIICTTSAPGNGVGIPMEMRRQVYLIFKEAVHNAVKHAACTRVEVGIEVNEGELALTVRDNGAGFVIKPEYTGNGLQTMHRRAAAMGGTLNINSRCGEGTTVRVTVPLT